MVPETLKNIRKSMGGIGGQPCVNDELSYGRCRLGLNVKCTEDTILYILLNS